MSGTKLYYYNILLPGNITKIVETSQNNMEIKVKLNKEQYVNVDGLISSERN